MRTSQLFLLALAGTVALSACQCGPADIIENPDASVVGRDGGPGADAGPGNNGGDGGLDGSTPLPDAGPVVTDPNDPANANRDSDCDGLSDQFEFSATYGASGAKTDPGVADSDQDGIKDGVELGRTTSPDVSCGFVGDSDPTNQTSPVAADSDGDGLRDGQEDKNGNGRTDPGDLQNGNPDTDGDGLIDGPTQTLGDGGTRLGEDLNGNGSLDANETNPLVRDTDSDGINDGIERRNGTNPTLADSDGDTCLDGAEDFNQNGIVDTALGETDPKLAGDCGGAGGADTDTDGLTNAKEAIYGTDPNVADTDNDGLSDGTEDANKNGAHDLGETNALSFDTDCDGLTDGPNDKPTAGRIGEAGPPATDPTKFDTDTDGISDGVERGVASVPNHPNGCGVFRGVGAGSDGGTPTTTNPVNPDSDNDGIPDGAEDTNQNGVYEPQFGELNPGQNDTLDAGSPVAQVCTQANLRPVIFHPAGPSPSEPDLKLALPPTFTELTQISVDGGVRGLMGYDPTNKVAFLAFKRGQIGNSTTPAVDEARLRPEPLAATPGTLNAIAAISNAQVQTFTTWDGFPGAVATYEQAGNATELKARANAIVDSLVGPGAGSLTGSSGFTGPFKIQAEYVHRSNESVVVVMAITPLSLYREPGIFTVTDTAGGTSLAQFGDSTAVQCETFQPSNSNVDFLFVVDDSCSMAAYQNSLAAAGASMQAALDNSTLNWRLAMVSTDYHYDTNAAAGQNEAVIRGFTRNINQFRSWLTSGSACTANGCSLFDAGAAPCTMGAPGYNNGCWIGTASGDGAEGALGAAARAVDALSPGVAVEQAGRLRDDATLVVVVLGDADDQTRDAGTVYSGSGRCGGPSNLIGGDACTALASFNTFFNGANKLGVRIPVHGIICPAGQACGEFNYNQQTDGGLVVQRHRQVIQNTGGIAGDISDAGTINSAMGSIVSSSIGAAGYKFLKPPIGATVKVAMTSVVDPNCNAADLPRGRVDGGFDIDGIQGTLSFFGGCRPDGGAVQAAVSYRYWRDETSNPNGGQPPCSNDPFFQADAGVCQRNLVCNTVSGACECPANCAPNQGSPNQVCNANPAVCDFECKSDCGGGCTGYQVCNTGSCSCTCAQSATCAPGYRFDSSQNVCGCVCDAAQTCSPGSGGAQRTLDTNSCSCVCQPNCGGCATGFTCNPSTCACTDSTIG